MFERFWYVEGLVGDGTHALVFTAAVAGHAMYGLDQLRLAGDGLVAELTVMVRPLSAVVALAMAMGLRVSHRAEAPSPDPWRVHVARRPPRHPGTGDDTVCPSMVRSPLCRLPRRPG